MESFEWPPGSGVYAEYQPHELELVRSLIAQAKAGEIEVTVAKNQIDWIHGFKALLGAKIRRPNRYQPGDLAKGSRAR